MPEQRLVSCVVGLLAFTLLAPWSAAGEPPPRTSVLVQLQRGADRTPVREFAARQGGRIRYEYRILPDLINLRGLPDPALRALGGVPGVVRWEEDREVHAFLNDSTPLIRALQSQIAAAGLAADGAGIRVCIVDSGIDGDHAMYADRIDLAAGRDFVNGDDDPEDDFGHGSHVAGIAVGGTGLAVDQGCAGAEPFQGVAPAATVIGVKVLGSSGVGTLSDVIAGIDYCADQSPAGARADVINLSLGAGSYSGACDTALSAAAANAAVDAGVVAVAAAGNAGLSGAIGEPACGSKVMAVGATFDDDYPSCEFPTLDRFDFSACRDVAPATDQVACFSNRSPEIDVVAPGCLLSSADYSSSPNGIVERCGTSMAAPQVAGLAALLLGVDPSLPPASVRQIIRNGAVDLGITGRDDASGYGRIDTVSSLTQLADPCSTDADCDDGLFCTRDDLCVEGLCFRFDDPCAGQVCDEPTDRCVECVEDRHCDDGDHCTIDRCSGEVCEHDLVPGCPDHFVVTDLGATGDVNYAYAVNGLGEAVGYRSYNDYSVPAEGFFSSCGEITYVGTPKGADHSYLFDLNDRGEAVGYLASVGEDPEQAILWNGKSVKTLGTLGGGDTYAFSINDHGQVVGQADDAANMPRPFLWENGAMQVLPTLGGDRGEARWINDAGRIVGRSNKAPGEEMVGCVWERGTLRELPAPALPTFVHDNGDIVGWTLVDRPTGSRVPRAAIWRDGQPTTVLGTLADGTPAQSVASSFAYGINADGWVVGESTNVFQEQVPFLWLGGEMIQLDDLIPEPWETREVRAGAINDAGQIVVTGYRSWEKPVSQTQGMMRALILTPVARSPATTVSGELQGVTPLEAGGKGGQARSEEWNLTCDDGLDNDADTLTDCEDSDCAGDPSCGVCGATTSPPPPSCVARGGACVVNADCCSERCKGNGTCR